MPTTLPVSYTSALYSPFLSRRTASLFYLVLPPFLTLLLTAGAAGLGHHSLRAAARAINIELNHAACDEMGPCALAGRPTIRKLERRETQ
jgi:hypothetical protein